jgi:branched-chain amino acid transport system substrate-binding protein
MQGETGHNGAQFVVDNCGGHILDTPVEIVWLDESSPLGVSANVR